MKKLIIPFLIVITTIFVGCNSSEKKEANNEKEVIEEKKIDSLENHELIKDSVSCLDISFIENLESGWESGYKDPRLANKGFTRVESSIIENGEKIIFNNVKLKNRLEISKAKYPDGEETFRVEYFIHPDQFKYFEKQLEKNKEFSVEYEKHIEYARYKKKGLGTYEKKVFVINASKTTVTYFHTIGKELQASLIEEIDDVEEIEEIDDADD